MCYFVTLGIGEKGRTAVEALGERHGIFVSLAKNPSVTKLFPSKDTLFHLTHGGCSCDLYVDPAHEEAPKGLVARYRKKGWSEAKIQRALAGRRKAHTRHAMADYRLKFCDLVSMLAEEFGSIRLFAHLYNGEVETEHVGTTGRMVMGVEEFRDCGGRFVPDTLVEVSRKTEGPPI